VALKVLCIPPTSCAGERLFSSFAHIWSDKRSRLLMGRMQLMTYVYFNMKVMKRRYVITKIQLLAF
jgi:hypothetical protein